MADWSPFPSEFILDALQGYAARLAERLWAPGSHIIISAEPILFDTERIEQYKIIRMDLLTPKEAARLVTVSYPTIKKWIYAGKVRSVKTPGGHHRIPRSEVERLTGGKAVRGPVPKQQSSLDAISGRNKLLGTITQVRKEGLLAQVTMDVGGQTITSIITSNACRELGLRKGMRAFALVKATEVMVIRG